MLELKAKAEKTALKRLESIKKAQERFNTMKNLDLDGPIMDN